MPETGIALFGGVRIERDGRPLPAGPAQQRAVLALLALAGGQPVGRAALLSALWPGLDEAPPSAWNIVQTHVKRLRAALEPDRPAHRPSVLLPSVGDGYALRPGADAVDVLRFRALVESTAEPHRQGDHAAVWRLLREALESWTAEPAADVPQLNGHPWLVALQAVHYAAVARYLDTATALGRGAEVVELAEQSARGHPLDELAQARLERRRRRRPADPAYLMPTPVGNILRAAERRPVDKYGLDTVVLWPRLWLLLPDTARQELLAARTTVDSAVTAAIWGVLFCGFTIFTPYALPAGIVVAVASVAVILPARAQVFGDLIETAYDLHRTALYRQLRWPLPTDPATEPARGGCSRRTSGAALTGLPRSSLTPTHSEAGQPKRRRRCPEPWSNPATHTVRRERRRAVAQ